MDYRTSYLRMILTLTLHDQNIRSIDTFFLDRATGDLVHLFTRLMRLDCFTKKSNKTCFRKKSQTPEPEHAPRIHCCPGQRGPQAEGYERGKPIFTL